MRQRVIGLVVAAVLLAVHVAAADRIDRVLAVVNGTVITESDVRAALAFGLVEAGAGDRVRTTLDQLIRRQLIVQEIVRSASVEPAPAAVSKEMEAIRARFPSASVYQARLAETAMDESRLRDHVDVNLRVEDYLAQRFGAVAEPGEEEVAAYYEAHRNEFTSGGRQLALDEARADVRQRLIAERRAQTVDEWVARLRRRAEVADFYYADAK